MTITNKNKDNLAHEAGHARSHNFENDNKDIEDNEVQQGLTGESDDDESGNLDGNAAGNPEEQAGIYYQHLSA
jgi:hypothetical protein